MFNTASGCDLRDRIRGRWRDEQYERHTAWDRPGGLDNRSGPGDLDVIVYSARKWARLALASAIQSDSHTSRPMKERCARTARMWLLRPYPQ